MSIKKISLSSLLITLCMTAAAFAAQGNVVANPSFEDGGKGWNIWGGEVGSVAKSGKAGLTIRNTEVKWSGADQSIVLPEGAARINVSGWIKSDSVVPGLENWERARISVEFRDELGKLMGGYPPAVGQTEGTTDWKQYTREYRVPGAAKIVYLQCALGNALGTAHFDDVTLTIHNRAGETLASGRLTGLMDEGKWYKLKPSTSGGHYVDWSGLLDPPAGKHGFLTVKDGALVFENGTPAKFWGTNLVEKDNFASNAEIDSAVSRLAKMGVNMLRLHHMDAPWTTPNIFGNAPSTRKFSPESMRQLDYLISKCKERGIYIFLDFLVHRDFKKEDGVENTPPDLGGKQIGFFNKKIIELQKEYNENLLNHVNHYTGIAYKDEPAIAASAFINESTVFGGFSGDMLTPPYRDELEAMWQEWLAKNNPAAQNAGVDNAGADAPGRPSSDTEQTSESATEKETDSPATDVAKSDTSSTKETTVAANAEQASDTSPTPETENNAVIETGAAQKLSVFNMDYVNDRPRLKPRTAGCDPHESIKFLSDIEVSYFRDMRDHARKVGMRYPVAGSNMPLPLLAMLKNNAEMDIICTNDYWDHPQTWKIDNDWDRILEAPINNRSQLKNLSASVIQNRSYYRIDGKPFIITEWNHCYPNEYVLEGVPLISAYGALQGWNGLLQFDFNLKTLGADRIHSYKLSVQPEDVAQWVMAAPLFLRGDVKAAPGLIVEGITDEQTLNVPSYSDMLERNFHLPFVTKVAKNFDGKSKGNIDDYAKYYDKETGVIRSETGELTVDGNTGFMRIDAARVQGASGFIGGQKLVFPLMSYEISNKHASIFAVSADGADLDKSKRFYIIATGPAKMDGQVYDPSRNSLENAGSGDVLVQVIEGKLTFNKVNGKKIQIFPLDPSGKRGKALKTKRAKGTAGVFDLSKGRTLVYEVVVK